MGFGHQTYLFLFTLLDSIKRLFREATDDTRLLARPRNADKIARWDLATATARFTMSYIAHLDT
jgi:hypothetical protein